jgi:hypothetical protein
MERVITSSMHVLFYRSTSTLKVHLPLLTLVSMKNLFTILALVAIPGFNSASHPIVCTWLSKEDPKAGGFEFSESGLAYLFFGGLKHGGDENNTSGELANLTYHRPRQKPR